MQPDQIAHTISRIFQQLPPQLGALPEDAKLALKLTLQKALDELDCISREEFETQQQVLYKTRQKVDALEARLNALLAEQDNQDADPENP